MKIFSELYLKKSKKQLLVLWLLQIYIELYSFKIKVSPET